MRKEHQVLTTQTKLTLDENQSRILHAYAFLFCQSKRKLTSLTLNGQLKGLKRKQIKDLVCGEDLAYRQFKGVESAVSGMIDSRKTNIKNSIANLESKISYRSEALKKLIRRIDVTKNQEQKDKLQFKIYQKQLSVNILMDKLNLLKKGKLSFCFGGKALLRERSTLVEQEAIADWKERWYSARHDEIVLVGSSDEKYGNQNCQLVPNDDGEITAFLRLPPALEAEYGTHLSFQVPLRYYRDNVLQALGENNSPLTYRFKFKNNAWYVFITFRSVRTEVVTWQSQGALGIDINADHLAATLITSDGNYKRHWTIPTKLRGLSSDKRNDIIGNAVKQCVDIALENHVPLVIESLDFTKKKRALNATSKHQARMLSSLAYAKTKQCFLSRTARLGVEVILVNPAYTSQLGELKYQDRYGLSRHHAAAMVIARRGLGFSETIPKTKLQFNNGRIYLHNTQVMDCGRDKIGKTIIDTIKRALKARDGYVLDTENPREACASHGISVNRLNNMLNRHAQETSSVMYHELLTKLRIEQKQYDQV